MQRYSITRLMRLPALISLVLAVLLIAACDSAELTSGEALRAGPEESARQAKVVICHRTSSDSNSFIRLEVAGAALSGHLAHGDARVGDPVPGMPDYEFGEDCAPALAVVVMTYNLYLGTDIFDLVGAPPQTLPLVVSALYAEVVASDFPTRAQAIAAMIDEHNPHLIGLQEVTLYRTQTPSDIITGNMTPNASEVTYDFLQILLDALAARGLSYSAVATTINADVELPSTTDGQTFTDIRFTDRDVILARQGVTVSNVVEQTFPLAVTAIIPVGGLNVPFTRGYNHLSATVGGKTFTFANAHLEVQVQAPQQPQEGQALILLNALENLAQPLVLVGDFNSRADGTGTQSYNFLTARYTDAAVEAGAEEMTCCQAADLRNPVSQLYERVDLILYEGNVTTRSFETLGNEPADRVSSGGDLLWPSDHAGAVAKLLFNN